MLALLSLCAYVVMCCDVRIDAGTKCWSSGKGDYHVGHVTGGYKVVVNDHLGLC